MHVLDGGVDGWVAAGLPVQRGRERVALERQVCIAAGTLAAAGGLLATFVNPIFGLFAGFAGGGLVFAGMTNTCGMAMLLARLPCNRAAAGDVSRVAHQVTAGSARPERRAPARQTCCQ